MNSKKTNLVITSVAIAAALTLAVPAFAQTTDKNTGQNDGWNQGQTQQGQGRGNTSANKNKGMVRPGVVGTVTSISGNIITINGRQGFGTTTATVVYTVDVTNATVRKNNSTSTISSILVGDMISARGTISGKNVTATSISDGVMMGPGRGGRPNATSTPQVIGNGQPVIAGSIASINGNILTVTTVSNVTYTVDATNAKILKGQSPITLSNITVGDRVVVQGSINGTSVTASTVVDQPSQANNQQVSSKGGDNNQGNPPQSQPRGFFANIGHFFTHLFGF